MKKNSCTGIFGYFIILMFGLSLIVGIYETLTEERLLWVIPTLIIGYFLVRWLLKKQKEKKRIECIQKFIDSWGVSYCDWLIENGYDAKTDRISKLSEKIPEWGEDTVKNLIKRRIGLGLTPQMAALSLGRPTKIDMQELSSRGEKYRWVYGSPQRGALYLWFKDHVAYKINFNKNIIQQSSIGGSVKIINNFAEPEALEHNTQNRRERIPDVVQMFVWQRDGGKCVKCGSNENLEFDHIIPLSKGGSNSRRNIQLLCENCNRTKSANIGG